MPITINSVPCTCDCSYIFFSPLGQARMKLIVEGMGGPYRWVPEMTLIAITRAVLVWPRVVAVWIKNSIIGPCHEIPHITSLRSDWCSRHVRYLIDTRFACTASTIHTKANCFALLAHSIPGISKKRQSCPLLRALSSSIRTSPTPCFSTMPARLYQWSVTGRWYLAWFDWL